MTPDAFAKLTSGANEFATITRVDEATRQARRALADLERSTRWIDDMTASTRPAFEVASHLAGRRDEATRQAMGLDEASRIARLAQKR